MGSGFCFVKQGGLYMNWKKVVSVLLVSAMTLSMAACGDTASTSDNAAAGTETKGSTANAIQQMKS